MNCDINRAKSALNDEHQNHHVPNDYHFLYIKTQFQSFLVMSPVWLASINTLICALLPIGGSGAFGVVTHDDEQ